MHVRRDPGDAATGNLSGRVAAPETAGRRRGRLALSTAFFSFATGLSRVAGLVREVVAASYFGVSGAMSAFTIAFQFPNLIRALFADAALQGAFVPVFTELLERGERKEAFRIASSLFFLIFLLLALSGLLVGMLNSFGHFSVPALAPLAWNVVIIAALVGLVPVFPEEDEIYAYAIGVLAGTIVQLVMPMPWLRGRGGRFTLNFDWRNEHVVRVLKLMLPVTIALGLINFSLLINSFFGTLVQEEAPAAIDKAFRIYMLPQGLFSVAIATILFPTLARYATRMDYDALRRTMANGVRQIALLLIPCAVIMGVLAEPITRLVYERGEFDAAATDLVAEAMLWWSLSLPFQGISLLLSRTYFSLQRPWVTTALSGANLLVNALVSLALYEPFGIAGVVLGTVVGTIGMTVAQALYLRPDLGGVEGRETVAAAVRMLVAAAALGAVSYGVWYGLDQVLGRALAAQVASVGGGILAGLAVYAAGVWALRVPEAAQIRELVASRFGRAG